MNVRRFAEVAVVGAALASAPRARGEAGPERRAAEELFEAGRRAMTGGRYEEACRKFEASLGLEAAVGTLFNLANCNEKRGRAAQALQQYRDVVSRLPANDERAPIARTLVQSLEKRVPTVTFSLSASAPSDAVVLLDEAAVPKQGFVNVPVDAGDHKVVVRSPNRADKSYVVSLAEGEHLDLQVEPSREPRGAAPVEGATIGDTTTSVSDAGAAPEATKKLSTPHLVGYVAGGVGIAALGTSLITGVLASSKAASMDDHCTAKPNGGGRYCDPAGLDAHDSARSLGIVSDVTLGVGLIGVGAATWLLFFRTEHPATAQALATPLPGGGRLDVKGSF